MDSINQPSDIRVSSITSDGSFTGEMKYSKSFGSKKTDKFKQAQKFVDSEVLRLCDPMVPKRSGALIASGVSNTVIGSGKVVYRTPYARRWYYQNAKFNGAPMRGTKWFERMKSRSAKDIQDGVMKIVGN